MAAFLRGFGVFRIFLASLAIILMVCSQFAEQWSEAYEGSHYVALVVSASMTPILFFLLLFDVMMNRIQMADKQGDERQRFQKNGRVELFLTLLLALFWAPYFIKLAS